VDKTLYPIVITNLLTDAIKYNRPNGEIILRAEETDDRVIISVCDTGIGISEEDCKNIFEKFFRSNEDNVRQISGHGLGLALARDIVQMNNGTLRVKSEIGKGSEFILEITRDTELLMKVG
jgi:two-component system phosphate regulon sensor histidine kinase PhoR